MQLTVAETQQLERMRAQLAMFDQIRAVTSGLGASHSSQGISASYSSEQIKMAFGSSYGLTQRIVDMLEAKQNCQPMPPMPGVNLSYYVNDSANGFPNGSI